MPDKNIDMLQTVANGLGELKDHVVFVGGTVAELYADDPAASDIRPTKDVDCVIELSSRLEHAKLEKNLRSKGFAHDTSEDAPLCRMIYREIKVDVMPTDEDILGFSNKWYVVGIENKMMKILPDGTEIFVFTPLYYIAAKFEAHKGRGEKDLRQNHDFEDIIYILDNYSGIFADITKTNDGVRIYLKKEFRSLLRNGSLTEGIECTLPYGSGDEGTEIMVNLIKSIAEIE
ncbi:MAG: hypothetical protein K8R53_13025 [Bacteroidales bacterium]|nr:hypothetical protein [Bacteroidales bacterium]